MRTTANAESVLGHDWVPCGVPWQVAVSLRVALEDNSGAIVLEDGTTFMGLE